MDNAIPSGLYKHFRGGIYHVLGTARHSETEEVLVVYETSDNPPTSWVRPLSMFTETVTHDGAEVPRFTPINHRV